jgi:hypothetical protein
MPPRLQHVLVAFGPEFLGHKSRLGFVTQYKASVVLYYCQHFVLQRIYASLHYHAFLSVTSWIQT